MLLHNGNSNTGSDELIVESIEVSVSSAHENVDIELSTIEQTDHKQFHDIRVTSHETTHRIQSSIHQSLSRTNFYQIDHLSVVYMTSSLVIISIFILLFLNIKRNVNKKNKFPSIISSISSSNISNPSLQIDIFDAISHDQSIDNMYVSMSEAKRTISSESMEVNISNTESLISLSALDALESLINSNINTFEFLIKYRLSKGNQNFSIQAGMKSTQMLQDWVDLKRQVLETSSVLDINKIRTLTSSHNQVKLVETKLRSCIEPVNSTSSKSTLLPQVFNCLLHYIDNSFLKQNIQLCYVIL